MHVYFKGGLRAAAALLAMVVLPRVGLAQQLPAGTCDFDIADDLGRFMYGSTLHLSGRAGASTNRGEFFIINADSAEYDVDKDGYNQAGTGCDYNNLYVPPNLRVNLVNTDNPAIVIPAQNVVLVSLPRRLPNGTTARVEAFVEIPNGTPAGRYVGEIQIRDSVKFVQFGNNNETLGADRVFFDVTVSEERAFAIVNADSAAVLDSLVIRGRAGQRASGVVRIANTGNVNLSDIRITATDLLSESGVGLVIPAQNIAITPANLAGIQNGDTTRVTVTVQIPRGILGGRYRGALIVQAGGTAAQQIPLILIVTSTQGILFGNNPVREIAGDIANIAFNGDPGTQWRMAIYDMAGLVTFKTTGTVFAGVIPPSGTTPVGADFAVNVIWPLRNGRGEGVVTYKTTGTVYAGIPVAGSTTGVDADFAVNFIWPLRNGRGEGVASGMYLVVVESIVDGKRQLAQDKLMVIR